MNNGGLNDTSERKSGMEDDTDGSDLCQSCHKNKSTEPHCCPYQSDIKNNEDEEYCTCCSDCERECRMAL